MSGSRFSGLISVVLAGALSLMMASCGLPQLSSAVSARGDERPFESPLPVNSNHRRLAIGTSAVAGVKEDGTVWTWGSGQRGQLGDGQIFSSRATPGLIRNLNGFIEVVGTGDHFLALRKDGTVWSWGNNDKGQLGYKTDRVFSATPRMVNGLRDIIKIAAAEHSLALDNKGRVWAFGSNSNMQLAISPIDEIPHYDPRVVYENKDAVNIFAYAGTSGLLTKNGRFYYWGGNLFNNPSMEVTLPKEFVLNSRIVDVALSDAIYVLTDDGFVWAKIGGNYRGQLGQGNFNNHSNAVRIKNISRIVGVASRYSSGIALDENGGIWQWGKSVRFKTIPTVKANNESYPIKIASIEKIIAIESNTASAVLLDDGKVLFWGQDGGIRGTGKFMKDNMPEHDWSTPEQSLWSWK